MDILNGLQTIFGSLVGMAITLVNGVVSLIMGTWVHIDPGAGGTDHAIAFWAYCGDWVDVGALQTIINVSLKVLAFSIVVKFVMWAIKLIPLGI